MTTATMEVINGTVTESRPRRSLEELVDRLMATLTFPHETGPAAATSDVVPAIHEARRLRQSGNLDGALETLASANLTTSVAQQARWAFTEWRQLVKRRFGQLNPLTYSQETGRAAALVPRDGDGTLEVVAALGMSWKPGKLVSRRSLRGLRPLSSGGA